MLRQLLKRIVSRCRYHINTSLQKRQRQQLKNAVSPTAKQVTKALEDWTQKAIQDQAMIDAIEAQRQAWLKDETPLSDIAPGFNNHHTIRRACQASKKPNWASLLYYLVKQLKAERLLELGTNLGISSAYMAAALPNNGRLITLEGSKARTKLARSLHEQLGIQQIDHIEGRFEKTLAETLDDNGPFDLAFIDGHHQYKPTLKYLQQIYPAMRHPAVIIFDDIQWTEDMEAAWQEISQDPRFECCINVRLVGICITRPNGEAGDPPPVYRW